jgi:hypothetical protein
MYVPLQIVIFDMLSSFFSKNHYLESNAWQISQYYPEALKPRILGFKNF